MDYPYHGRYDKLLFTPRQDTLKVWYEKYDCIFLCPTFHTLYKKRDYILKYPTFHTPSYIICDSINNSYAYYAKRYDFCDSIHNSYTYYGKTYDFCDVHVHNITLHILSC